VYILTIPWRSTFVVRTLAGYTPLNAEDTDVLQEIHESCVQQIMKNLSMIIIAVIAISHKFGTGTVRMH
jgi:hypothetical protein